MADLAKRLTGPQALAGLGKSEGVQAFGIASGFEFSTDKAFLDVHYALAAYSFFSFRGLLEGGYSWGQQFGYGNAIFGVGLLVLMFDLGVSVPFKDEKARFVYGPSLDLPLDEIFFRLYYRIEHLGANVSSFKKLGIGFAFRF